MNGKTIIRFLFLFFLQTMIAESSKCQTNDYFALMKRNIHLLDSDFTIKSYAVASEAFENIASQEKKLWLPIYYAAFSNIMLGTLKEKSDEKDILFKKAIAQIESADKLSPSNSEIVALKAFAMQMYISVSPYTRAISNYSQVNDLIDRSISLNTDNPRAYYLKAAGLYYSPALFGGGKTAALKWFKVAEEKYRISRPDDLLPHWGADWVEHMIKQCE